MGRRDSRQAREVLIRVLKLGVTVGSVLAVLMVLGAGWAPAAFTSDARIIATAQRVFPLLGLMLVRLKPLISSPRPQLPLCQHFPEGRIVPARRAVGTSAK